MVLAPARLDAGQLKAEFARRLARRAYPPARVIGVEHEYSLWRDDDFVDFRSFAPQLSRFGASWHPTDPLVFRCPDGTQLQADANVAEVASPPIPLEPGFARALVAYTARGRSRIEAVAPDGASLKGESSHLSVSAPPATVRRLALRYLQTFAPALMLLADRANSPGLLVRPRPGRLELCTEHLCGDRLAAVLTFIVGSVRALESAGERPPLPYLELSLEAARGRLGWFAASDAFTAAMYESPRDAVLCTVEGNLITAGMYLDAAWRAARPWVQGTADAGDLGLLDAIVRGDAPLGVERPLTDPVCDHASGSNAPDLPPHLEPPEARLHPRHRPGFTIRVDTASWDFVAFRATSEAGSVVLAAPRAQLSAILAALDAGDLDALTNHALHNSSALSPLTTARETESPGLYSTLVRSDALLPRDVMGVGSVDLVPEPSAGRVLADLHPSEIDYPGIHAATSPPASTSISNAASSSSPPAPAGPQREPRAPKGTVPPSLVAPADGVWWRRWLLPSVGVLVAVVAFLGLQTLGGDDDGTGVSPPVTLTPVTFDTTSTATPASAASSDTPEPTAVSETTGLSEAFNDPGSFMSITSQGSFGADGRGLSSDPPSWAADVIRAAVRGDDGIVYVRYRLPAELAARLCGEFDVTEGNAHIGEGVDWCAPGAAVPFYFDNVQEVDLAGATGQVDLVIWTGISDNSDNVIRAWLLFVDSEGAYQGIEYAIRASNVPTAPSGTSFPERPPALPYAVVGGPAGAPVPAASSEPATDGESGGRSAPDDLPADLILPGAEITFIGNSGSGETKLVRLASTSTLAEVTEFYSASLGTPRDIGGTPTWFTDGPSGIITIGLRGGDGAAQVDIVLYGQ